MKNDVDAPKPRSPKQVAVENAANDFLRGDEVAEPCPECGAVLEVTVARPDVLVRCPNGHIDAHRSLRSDPGGAMRWGFVLAAAIIIGLALARHFYFDGLPDPHATQYFENDRPWVTNIPTPAVPDRRDERAGGERIDGERAGRPEADQARIDQFRSGTVSPMPTESATP